VKLLASDEPFHGCVFQYYDTLKVRCAGVSHQAIERPQKPLASCRFLVFRQTSVLLGVSITNQISALLTVFTSVSEHRLLYEFVTLNTAKQRTGIELGQVQGFRLTQHWFEYFI
jgi:hypothetical protein